MSASGRRDQIARLFQILFAMRAGHPNAGDLAALCEVSPRTIYRDLAALEQAGVPIRYRGDAQGYEIAPIFTLPVPHLSRAEAVALVAASRALDEAGAFLDREIRTAIGKILSTLSPADRGAVEAMGRLLIPAEGHDDSRPSTAQASLSAALFEGLSTGCHVRVWFEEGLESDPSRTIREETLGIYRLVRMRRQWHLLGRRNEGMEGASTVTMCLPSIRRAELTTRPFPMPHEEEVAPLLRMAGLSLPLPPSGFFVHLRALERLAHHLPATVWHPVCRFGGGREGWQELTLVVDQVDPFLETVRGLGDGVEILSPLNLIARLKEFESHCRCSSVSSFQNPGGGPLTAPPASPIMSPVDRVPLTGA